MSSSDSDSVNVPRELSLDEIALTAEMFVIARNEEIAAMLVERDVVVTITTLARLRRDLDERLAVALTKAREA